MDLHVASIRALPAVLLTVVVMAAAGTPVTRAVSDVPCSVRNATQDTRGASFRRMVAAAHPGDRLRVRGTCTAGVTIRKSLVIRGVGTDATLSGRQRFRVLRIEARGTRPTHVRIRHMRIIRGTAVPRSGFGEGAGILVKGRGASLDLIDSTVARNARAGGIAVSRGTVVLTRSVVRGNTSLGHGGGIQALRHARVTLIDSVVRGNYALDSAGIDSTHASVTLIDSAVFGNTAIQSAGGIGSSDGELRLLHTSVRANRALLGPGGGIAITRGTTELVGSAVIGNVTGRDHHPWDGHGGGIFVVGRGVDEPPASEAVISLIDTTVSANRATREGGGIHAGPSTTVTFAGAASVTGNDPDDCYGTPAC
jgi:hypothetical protein